MNKEEVIVSLPPIKIKFRRHGTKIYEKIGKKLVFVADSKTEKDAIAFYQSLTNKQQNKPNPPHKTTPDRNQGRS